MEKDNFIPDNQNSYLDEEEFLLHYLSLPPDKIKELKEFNTSLRKLVDQFDNYGESSQIAEQIDEKIQSFLAKECSSNESYLIIPSHPYLAHLVSKYLPSILVNKDNFSFLEDDEKLINNAQFGARLVISEILTNITKPQNINLDNKNRSFLIHIQFNEEKKVIDFEFYDFNPFNPQQKKQMDIIREGKESIQEDLDKKVCEFTEGGRGLNIVALYCDKFDVCDWYNEDDQRIGHITKLSINLLSNK